MSQRRVASFKDRRPDPVLAPTTEQEMANAIALAQTPLSIRGGGTRGALVDGDALTTANLSGITLYEPGALTIVAKAGTPVAEIEAALAAENQMLAFEPMDCRTLTGADGEPTIGGVVATNASGPRRVQAGACRDFLLGVRFVDGMGNVIKNGGRVMKNVTGYDLARLMCGARGTLGVLSEVSLKVLPKPEHTATLIYEGIDRIAAIQLFTKAMQSPFDVSGAAWVAGDRPAAYLRLEGFETSVQYRAQALTDILGPAQIEGDRATNTSLWQSVSTAAPLADRDGDVWSVSIKPTDSGQLMGVVAEENTLIDWAGGRLWMLLPKGTDLRAKMNAVDGFATLVKGNGLQQFHPETDPLAKMAAALRQKFDPKGILNPGLMD